MAEQPSTLINVVLNPRTDHHIDLHAEVEVPWNIIYDEGHDTYTVRIENRTERASYVYITWMKVRMSRYRDEKDTHSHDDDHDHHHGDAAQQSGGGGGHGHGGGHGLEHHGNIASAAYHYVVCPECSKLHVMDYERVKVAGKETASVGLVRKAIEPRVYTDPRRPLLELRQLYVGTLYDIREPDLHKGHDKPGKKHQLGRLFFIEHPFVDPNHPDPAQRHHTENVIVGN